MNADAAMRLHFFQTSTIMKQYLPLLLLLTGCSHQPQSTSVENGVLEASSVFIRYYAQRKDDFAWENRSSIWRAYGPALQKAGEHAYGYDIWCKNTSALVCDKRFQMEFDAWPLRDSLMAIGKTAESDSLIHDVSFHVDHGEGMDCYAVGPTLGGGATALLDQGQLVFPWCYKSYEILCQDPDSAVFRLDYDTTFLASDTIIEHRIITVLGRTRFCRCQVVYEGLSRPRDVAVGIVFHGDPDSVRFDATRHLMVYSDPSDQPDLTYPDGLVPYSRVQVGILAPQADRFVLDQGHLLAIAPYQPGDTLTYWFGSGWSQGDCPTLQTMINELKSITR